MPAAYALRRAAMTFVIRTALFFVRRTSSTFARVSAKQKREKSRRIAAGKRRRVPYLAKPDRHAIKMQRNRLTYTIEIRTQFPFISAH